MSLRNLVKFSHRIQKSFCLCGLSPRKFDLLLIRACGDVQYSRFYSSEKNIKYYEDVPKGWERVYKGPLSLQIRSVKWFSLSSSIIGVVSQPFLYKEITALGNIPLAIAAYSFVGFFTVLTPILLHLITKKYITLLDYNPEDGLYSAKTYTFLCMLKETKFRPEDVKVPDVPGMFTSMIVKGTPMFLDPRMFENTNHYARIMGYDKPIDFKLYQTSSNDKKT